MPVSVSASINVSADDMAALTNLPRQIEALTAQAVAALEAVRSGQNADNPLGGLIAQLERLARDPNVLPALDTVLAPLRSLTESLPTRAIADITAIRGSVGDILAMFGPVADLVRQGRLDQAVEEGARRVLDVAASQLRFGGEAEAGLSRIGEFAEVFQTIVNWRQRPPAPEEVVRVFSLILVGAPGDLLVAPVRQLNAALAPLEQLGTGSADFIAWRAMPAGRLDFWTRIEAGLTSRPDWARLEADLRVESSAMLDIRVRRDRALSTIVSGLGQLRLDGLAQVGSAIGAVPPVSDFRLTVLLDGLRLQIEDAAARLDAWAPTPEELRQLARSVSAELRQYLEASPLGELRNLMIDFQHRALAAIEGLPLKDMAREAERQLARIAHAIDGLDTDVIRAPIREFLGRVTGAIETAAAGPAREAVEATWQQVDGTFTEINAALEQVRATLQGLSDQLAALVGQIQPTMDAIAASVAEINAILEHFDLIEASDRVVEVLHDLRDLLAKLDLSLLPDPALSALHSGAQALRRIEVAAAVNPPLSEAMAKADPTDIIRSASGNLKGVFDGLAPFDPQTLVARLDGPVDELLAALSEFGPQRLEGLIAEAIRPVEDAIKGLDATALLAPVTYLYRDLIAKIDQVLNPDLIFSPLNELFQPINDLIDAVEPSRIIGAVAPHADAMGETASEGMKPPQVMASAVSGLRAAIAPAPEAAEALFGFRPGDLLIPVIDLYRTFRSVVDGIDDQVLDATAQALHLAFFANLDRLQPAAISLRVDAAAGHFVTAFQPGEVAASLGPAAARYRNAARRIATLARETGADGEPAKSRVIALLKELDPLTLVPDAIQVRGIVAASTSLKATLSLDGVRSTVPAVNRLRTFLPAALAAPDVGAAALRQLVAGLDPAPVRLSINAAFDEVGRRIVALQQPLMAGFDAFMEVAEDFLLPVSPGALVLLADRLHAGAKEQILALSPETFRDEVQHIFDTVGAKLEGFDPRHLAAELNAARDEALASLHQAAKGLLPDLAPFTELQQRLAQLKPSQVLKPTIESLHGFSQLTTQFDMEVLLEPLIEAIANVRRDVPEVVARIEAALDEVLDLIPEGGPGSVSVSASASISA
jgi:hypothetical protein